MKNYRPTYAEIDLAALGYNFRRVKKSIARGVKILVAVKANAYGHGVIEVSQGLNKLGVDYLGVATVDEAIELRKARIATPVLVFGSILPHEVKPVVKHNLTLSIGDLQTACRLDNEAKARKKKTRVHVKIDTGMGRMGIWHREAKGFIAKLTRFKNLKLEGIYTHFASADEEDSSYTLQQIADFQDLVRDLEKQGIDIPLKHAANSIGLMRFKQSHFNLVRPGLMIYGLYSHQGVMGNIKLKPVLSLKTKIVYLKKLSPGRTVSYGRTYVAINNALIAVLPVGYGDGYARLLSNKARVIVRGKCVPVVGTICMDQTMVDVTKIAGIKVGDSVVLIGRQGKEEIKAEELASLCDTISYEVVCGITKRVPRAYKSV